MSDPSVPNTPTPRTDLLGGPPATLLDGSPEASAALEGGTDPARVAADHPTDSAAWAALADAAWGRGAVIESYAYARTGYHRGLDALRRHGWKGYGPVPWSHTPNRGFLRALFALGRAAGAINETDEAARISDFLTECDPAVVRELS
ncbi:MAG TPA: DUF3151 domain-containing protein [Mycobacteriales bacterium]|jgi:hypothetical protein|nr:DUF3151 domain-containing protein [Mycobacteriales bacterium]